MKSGEMSPLQKKLLEMLKWFHEFCVEHDIRYYVIGGTMLGAARHKGFIPWDDDVDVALPRNDYNRLIQLFGDQKIASYVLETPYSPAVDYCYPYSKLYDTRTTLVEKKRQIVIRGVFIDVFPLDGLGESEEECRRNYKPIDRKYNYLLTLVTGLKQGRSWYKNLAVILMRCISFKFVDYKKILVELDKMSASIDYDSSTWICNNLGAYRLKEAMPKAVLGEPTLYRFEDIQVYGPADYDSYLTHLYGNWHQLPPKKMRGKQHDFLELDLTKPYMEYKRENRRNLRV